MSLKNRHYSKVEAAWFQFFFKQLVEDLQNNPNTDLKILLNKHNHYKRDFMRTAFGIQRLLIEVTPDGSVFLIVGLEDRKQNYTIKVGESND